MDTSPLRGGRKTETPWERRTLLEGLDWIGAPSASSPHWSETEAVTWESFQAPSAVLAAYLRLLWAEWSPKVHVLES